MHVKQECNEFEIAELFGWLRESFQENMHLVMKWKRYDDFDGNVLFKCCWRG